MFNKHRAQPARMESACPGLPPRLAPASDPRRAPVTFAWWAYSRGGRRSQYFHLETLYRIERARAPGLAAAFTRTEYYGVPVEQLREQVRERQAALLPRLPEGYIWVGPQLVEDIAAQDVPAVPNNTAHINLPRDRAGRLRIASEMAAAILREREFA
jgi:hypothetical protein